MTVADTEVVIVEQQPKVVVVSQGKGPPGTPGANGAPGPAGNPESARAAVLQPVPRRGAAARDNISAGIQSAAPVGAASVGTNINTFGGSGIITLANPADPYRFPSLTGPWYAPASECVLRISNGGSGATIGYASYTGTTFDSNGNITGFTGVTTLNSAAGVLASTAVVYSAPFATVDVVSCSDSILFGEGSNLISTALPNSDWFTALLAKENRAAGLPDPGRGWRPCYSPFFVGATWSNLGAGSQVSGTSHGPSAVSGGTETVCWNTGGNGNTIGDTYTFRRAIVFIEKQTNGATVKVSFDGGSTFTSAIATAGSGIIMIDSGDLGSYTKRTLQVVQQSTGSAGVCVGGYLPMATDGTAGVVGFNFAQSGTTIAQWDTYTGWDAYLRALQPRRVIMDAAVNDIAGGASVATVAADQTTCIGRIQAAAPGTEVDLCAVWHVGNTINGYNVGISSADWDADYVSVIAGVANATNAVIIDMSSWFGDMALWTANVTTTNGGASGLVASGGFPNVEDGMVVLGPTMPPVGNPVYVDSISGNTVNFGGNTAQIKAGSAKTLTFTNCKQGLSQNDGIHPGDSSVSISGFDAQLAMAEMFFDLVSHHKDAPVVAPAPGWSMDPYPWVRLTGTEFFVNCPNPTALALVYSVGTKVRWAESGTVKYGVVASSVTGDATVLVTLIPTTDYSLGANPDPGSMWHSFGEPPGFPAYFRFTPTWSGMGAAWAGAVQWSVRGGWLELNVNTLTPGAAAGTALTLTNLPLDPTSDAWGMGNGINNSSTSVLVVAQFASGSATATFYVGVNGGTWTNAGVRYLNGLFRYPIA